VFLLSSAVTPPGTGTEVGHSFLSLFFFYSDVTQSVPEVFRNK